MKTHSNALRNMKGFGIAIAYAVLSHTAGAERWAVDANPVNGFEGRTDLWELNQPGTMYAEWDIFGSFADDTPELSFGLRSASVTETSGNAFLTGGGNIYSFSGVTSFATTLAGTEPAIEGTRTVVARLKRWGRSSLTAVCS